MATTILSQAGLWAEGYLLTGLLLDAIAGRAPTPDSAVGHPLQGSKKGMVYSGTFMGVLSVIALLAGSPAVQRLAAAAPIVLGLLGGALAFPLAKAIIETFDGSQAFFRRVGNAYRDPMLYARGAIVGAGLAYGLSRWLPGQGMAWRVEFGFGVGVAAFAGVNLLRDLLGARMGRYRVQPARSYVVLGLLGGFIGAAIGFYLDAVQVEVVVTKFHRYVDPGQAPQPYDVYPLVSKWGFLQLGTVTGGASLLFAEALAGVISWSIPAWLFAINRTFMAAYFDRETAPIRALFTRAGLVLLVENMIGVLRWGLWMSPIINSFLRPMAEPTWYNQDGAIRTLVAIVHDVTSSPADFRAWSLGVFISLLAYDAVRILIWLDHMGLRVATLVNLSFLGMDRAGPPPGAVPRAGEHGAVHPRGREAVHDLGAAADPLLHPPGGGLGHRLEPGRDAAGPSPAPGRSRRSPRCRSPGRWRSRRGPSPSPRSPSRSLAACGRAPRRTGCRSSPWRTPSTRWRSGATARS